MAKPRKPRPTLAEMVAVTRKAIASGKLSPEQLAEAEANLKLVEGRSEAEVESLDFFLHHMPDDDADIILVILKGHLLIEQKVREFISERMLTPKALDAAQLETHQAICLAEALTLPNDMPKSLWETVKQLNTLRNRIAHEVEYAGIKDRIANIQKTYRKQFDVKSGFTSVLAHAYGQMSELVRLAQHPDFRMPKG